MSMKINCLIIIDRIGFVDCLAVIDSYRLGTSGTWTSIK